MWITVGGMWVTVGGMWVTVGGMWVTVGGMPSRSVDHCGVHLLPFWGKSGQCGVGRACLL